MATFFSDLRGVTVRNTFLEFSMAGDDLLPDSGLARQASEPVKPFNRQVSEQTTADGSGHGAYEEASAEAEERTYAQLASYLARTIPGAANSGASGAPRRGKGCGGGKGDVQAAFQQVARATTDSSSSYPQVMMSSMGHMEVAASQMTVVRFCPNCGAEVEPSHRFCPFCCYTLHSFQIGGGAMSSFASQPGGPLFPTPSAVAPQMALGQMDGRAGPPRLLESLRRFRFVEANPADVVYARAMCSQITALRNKA